jgi:hypothetical protein
MDPKALLDELMGKDRDLPFDQKKKKKLRFDDPEVRVRSGVFPLVFVKR